MKQDLFSEAPALVREFLGYQSTVKGRSPKTVTEYYLDLRTFFRYLKYTNGSVSPDTPFQEISIADVTEEMITSVTLTQVFEYMNFLISERDNHAASRQRKTSSLRMFYKFLTNQKHLMDVSPLQQLESPKQKKSLPKYLTLEQSLELLNAIDGPDVYKRQSFRWPQLWRQS